jgi:hypothetical protein
MHTACARCILPVDGFYEWKAIKGQRAKQRLAIRDCEDMGKLEGPGIRRVDQDIRSHNNRRDPVGG